MNSESQQEIYQRKASISHRLHRKHTEFSILPFHLDYVFAVLSAINGFLLGLGMAFLAAVLTPLAMGFDFLYNVIAGAKQGFRLGANHIIEELSQHRNELVLLNGDEVSHSFTMFETLHNWYGRFLFGDTRGSNNNAIDNRPNTHETDHSLVPRSPGRNYRFMRAHPMNIYAQIFQQARNNNPDTRSDGDIESITIDTMIQLYANAYGEGQYDMMDVLIGSFPNWRSSVFVRFNRFCTWRSSFPGYQTLINQYEADFARLSTSLPAANPNNSTEVDNFSALKKISPVQLDRRLNDKELHQANQYITANNTNVHQAIKKIMEQYQKLASALAANEDQLITLTEFEDNHTIILLVKQYCDPDNNWQAVPNGTVKTSLENAQKWFLESSKHPLDNDDILNPRNYNGLDTRYVWHVYEKKEAVKPKPPQSSKASHQLANHSLWQSAKPHQTDIQIDLPNFPQSCQLLNQLADNIRRELAKINENTNQNESSHSLSM